MGTSDVPREVRVAEAEMLLQKQLAMPAHASVAHVETSAMRYVEAAEYSMSVGCPFLAVYQIGIAEGVAMALRDVVGFNAGIHEHAVLRAVLQKALAIRTEVAKMHQESSITESEEIEIPIH